MRLSILLALALFLCSASASASSADDDIKDYVQYQKVRLNTYSDAVKYHERTKGTVIVWVGVKNDDETFKTWCQSRNLGYHVFVDKCGDLPQGITIAQNVNGVFAQTRFVQTLAPVVQKPANLAPAPAPCPNGMCPRRW